MAEELSSKRYEPLVLDLDDKNNSHSLIIDLTGKNKRVLEVGTSTGYISKVLKDRGNQVIGIELDSKASEMARQYCEKMIVGDVEEINLDDYLEQSSIDVVLLGDVLEHLKWPGRLIDGMKKYLAPGGYLVVSLPNVCHGDVLLNLLNGNFGYTPLGLLDETHLRFFARRNIFSIFIGCGYSICDLRTTKSPLGTTEQKMDLDKIPQQLQNFIKYLPDSDVYQFVFRAMPFANPAEETAKDVDFKKLFYFSIEDILREHSNQINVLTGQLQGEASRRKKLELAVADRDGQIKVLNDQLQAEISRTKSHELTVADLYGQLANLNGEVQQLTHRALTLDNELLGIKDSILWQLAMRYHNSIVEPLLPNCTERREAYNLCLKSGRIVVKGGLRSLCWHYNERKRVKAIERNLGLQTKRNLGVDEKFVLDDSKFDTINFPPLVDDPEVSIVIPAYKNPKYTYNCLKSLQKTNGSFEIIVVNDASNDETSDLLGAIENIRIIDNQINQGFLRSCNIGAESSKGKFVLFLNNDTIVTDNWLEHLLKAAKREGVGAVGAKLIFPDGKLQEAGGIVWNDASAWNYGRGDDPEKPEFNFVREVDYCSGAALLVKRDLVEKIGGFDERFRPIYYEDTDLCFSIRNLGFKVLYQPKSEIIHFEGISSGTDISSGDKRYQDVNRTKFLEKWKTNLMLEHYKADPGNLFIARDRRWAGKNILVIDHYVPTFDRDSGSYRMYYILRIMVDLGHKVTFIGDNRARIEPYTTVLQQYGVEVLYGPYIRSVGQYIAEYGKFFDIVILSRAHIAKNHIYAVKKYCNKAKLVFDTVALQFVERMREYKLENDEKLFAESENLKELEFRLARNSDMTLVVSQDEKEILLNEDPTLRVEVISNIQETKKCNRDFSSRKDILFLGGFAHPPNVDVVKWFVRDIFPLIKKKIEGIKFYVAGSEPPAEIESLAAEDIIITGYIPDLTSYFESCRVFVAPLRYGSGVKGKINQSMSFGLPVVTTTIGAEGIGLENGVNALIADNPEEFAEKVSMLYNDEHLWNKLSEKSIENVISKFSYEVATKRIENLIENLCDPQAMLPLAEKSSKIDTLGC